MLQDRWKAYLTYRIMCVRTRIQETERLMRPPTPEELIPLQKALQRLKAQEAQLTYLLTAEPPPGLFDPQGVGERGGSRLISLPLTSSNGPRLIIPTSSDFSYAYQK
jgi:hypothetical protein